MEKNREQLERLLAEIRDFRAQVLTELDDLEESEFGLSTDFHRWKWDELWRVVLQFGNHMREHANQVRGTRDKIGRGPTHPQRMLAEAEIAWGNLLAATVGLTDADLDVPPADSGWTMRRILEHVRNSEERYLEAARRARSG